MAFKQILAAAAAAALAFSPTAAGAARASVAASATAAQQEIAPAEESIEGASELRRSGILIPLAGILLIALAIYLLTKGNKEPRSP